MQARYIRSDCFDFSELICLGKVVQFRFCDSVAIPTFLERGVVEFAAHIECRLQSLPLLAMGIESVLEGLS